MICIFDILVVVFIVSIVFISLVRSFVIVIKVIIMSSNLFVSIPYTSVFSILSNSIPCISKPLSIPITISTILSISPKFSIS